MTVGTPVLGCPEKGWCGNGDTPGGVSLQLCGGGKHIFDKDTITHSRVIDEDMSVLMIPTASCLSVSVWMMPTGHSVFLPKSAENQMNYEEIGRICCLRIRPITLA